MLNFPNISLTEFSVSVQNGFLPTEPPLQRLSDSYYSAWENIMMNLPALIRSGEIRREILDLPVLSTARIHHEAGWQRAYLILAFLTHGYVWGGEQPEDKLPPSISCPFLEVSARLELPPCATYAALSLWNFTTFGADQDLTDPDNLTTLNSFTGTDDERWFFVISVAIEACGAKVIPLVFNAISAINLNDHERVAQLLLAITDCLVVLSNLLERMYERCAPTVFYHQIRPFLAGSKNMMAAGLPNGLFYDEGEGAGEWRQYSGGSNAQSSLIQLFDIALGVEHCASGNPSLSSKAPAPHRAFMEEMRNYMPGPHRRFLEHVAQVTNIRAYAMSLPASSDVRRAYNAAVMMLWSFRDKHIQIVSWYIISPARQHQRRQQNSTTLPPATCSPKRLNLATATSQIQTQTQFSSTPSLSSPSESEEHSNAAATSSSSNDEAPSPTKAKAKATLPLPSPSQTHQTTFIGTGSTALIPFLKQTRDETKAAARFSD